MIMSRARNSDRTHHTFNVSYFRVYTGRQTGDAVQVVVFTNRIWNGILLVSQMMSVGGSAFGLRLRLHGSGLMGR